MKNYINAALKLARYEVVEEDERVYGEIAELPGVWASGETQELCRKNLSVTIEGWILFRKNEGFSIPPIKELAWPDEGTPFWRGKAPMTPNAWQQLNAGLFKIKQWLPFSR